MGDSASPAAFGRLCVETRKYSYYLNRDKGQPPSGGCVLKPLAALQEMGGWEPAAFGRLCVETAVQRLDKNLVWASRLRAAVC